MIKQSNAPENATSSPLDIQRAQIIEQLQAVMEGTVSKAELPLEVTEVLSRAEVTALEAQGVILAGVAESHPFGGVYIKSQFRSTLPGIEEGDYPQTATVSSIYATGAIKGVTGLITRPPSPGIPDDLHGLKRIPVDSLVASVLRENSTNWSTPEILPDGRWVIEGFDNNAFQYGQEAFEGLVAASDGSKHPLVGENLKAESKGGSITIFRPEENAKRFINSCRRLNIPPPKVDQFVTAVTSAVRSNIRFVPPGGKLYIRPFVVGLEGGTGVKPASSYLFAVEVSPFGEYLASGKASESAETLAGINVQAVTYDRPEASRFKLGGGYAPIFQLKEKAKIAGYSDILLINKEGQIQEFGSSNCFIIRRGANNGFTITTPGTDQNILPGITRKSVVAILQDPKILQELGVEITVSADPEETLHETQLAEATGVFSTGTAAGITNIGSITDRQGQKIEYTDLPTQKLIKKIADLLVKLRRGQVEGYEDWALKIN